MSSSKSRRKSAVTHRAVNYENTNASDDDDEDDTAVVEPESPDEDRVTTKSATKRSSLMDAGFQPENCTACSEQINTANSHHCKRHPHLHVLLCRTCYKYCKSGAISRDKNGQDEQCFWCCEGGQLICCDVCPKAFCKKCIKRNLGRSELSDILNMDDDVKWRCYACSPAPLTTLVGKCVSVFKNLKKIEKKTDTNDVKSSPKPPNVVKTTPKICLDLDDLNIGNHLDTKNISLSVDKLVSDTNSFISKIKQAQNDCFKMQSKHGRHNPAYAEDIVRETRANVNKYMQRVLNLVGFSKNIDGKSELGVEKIRDSPACNGSIGKLDGRNSHKETVVIGSSDNDCSGDSESHSKRAVKSEILQSNRESRSSKTESVDRRDKEKTSKKHSEQVGETKLKTDLRSLNSNSEKDSVSDSKNRGLKDKHVSNVNESNESATTRHSTHDKNQNKKDEGNKEDLKIDKSAKPKQDYASDSEEDRRKVRGKGVGKRSARKEVKEDKGKGNYEDIVDDALMEYVNEGLDDEDTSDIVKVNQKDGKQVTILTGSKSKGDSIDDKVQGEEGNDGEDLLMDCDAIQQNEDTSMILNSEDVTDVIDYIDDVERTKDCDVSKEVEDGTEDDAENVDGETHVKDDGEDGSVEEDTVKRTRGNAASKNRDKVNKYVKGTTSVNDNDDVNHKANDEVNKNKCDAKSQGAIENEDEGGSEELDDNRQAQLELLAMLAEECGEVSKPIDDVSMDEDNGDVSMDVDTNETSEHMSEEDKKECKASPEKIVKDDSKKNIVEICDVKDQSDAIWDEVGAGSDDDNGEGEIKSKTAGEKAKDDKKEKGHSKEEKQNVVDALSDSESEDHSDDNRRKKRTRSKKGKKEASKKSPTNDKQSDDSDNDKGSSKSDATQKKAQKSASCKEDVSSGHDSELEKDIKALAKTVKLKLVPLKMGGGVTKSVHSDKAKSKAKSKKEKEEINLSTDEENDVNEDGEEAVDEEDAASGMEADASEDDVVSFKKEDFDAKDDDREEDEVLEEAKNMSPISDSSDSEPTPTRKKVVRNPKGRKKSDKKKEESESEEEDENDDADKNVTKTKKNQKLLDAKISSSSSDEEGKKKKKRKKKASKESDDGSEEDFQPAKKGKGRKRKKKADHSSGADSWSGLGTTDEDAEDDPNRKKKKGKKKRKRIKDEDNSDDGGKEDGSDKQEEEDDDDEDDSPDKGKRKTIRKVMSSKKLGEVSKAAAKAEVERRKRVDDLQKKFNIVQESDATSPTKCPVTTQLVLESDKDGEPVIEVHKKLIRKLKPHQVEAVQFMWTSLIETVERCEKEAGSGCILAHCMGLGKTLSVITIVHTLLTHEVLKLTSCLVVAPLNTVINWQNEWVKWLDKKDQLDVTELSSIKNNPDRLYNLKHWIKHGGIMIMGYQMFRMLSQGSRIKKKKMKEEFAHCLLDPGPDIVVCDEGHIIKNDSSGISKAMCKMKTRRRVVLTGTPLQNNLSEYHCMVDFVKPNLLGTRTEFGNRFVNPMTNGQCSDSTGYDVKLMKRRAHILHDLLSGCVQRRDYSALTKFLPPKLEYVITVRLSKVQMDLYEKYLSSYGIGSENEGKGRVRGTRLFADYQVLSRIWTHPWVLKMDEIRKINSGYYDKSESEDSFVNDESESESNVSTPSTSDSESSSVTKSKKAEGGSKGRSTRNSRQTVDDDIEIISEWKTKSRSKGDEVGESSKACEPESLSLMNGWWESYLSEEDHYKMELGGKVSLLFSILQMCGEIGDKVLVFTQSLLSLDLIEDFLSHMDTVTNEESTEKTEEEKLLDYGKTWVHGADYFRMDGSTQVTMRAKWADMFNDEDNYRSRLFLISTKAGSLGINLVAANRVIMFDASWNPSHDIQSIFRVYRFGQIKPVYVYRLLAQGTMEEKIYERQVTKQSLSQRVVDEHQIDRHFSSSDLQALYNFKPERLDDPARADKPTPVLPKDHLLAEILKNEGDWIVSYHEHDSLLENKIDQELDEDERKAAWEDYEDEKKGVRKALAFGNPGILPGVMGGMVNAYPNMAPQFQHGNQPERFDILQMIHQIRVMNPHLSGEALQNIVKNFVRQRMTMQHQEQQKQIDMNLMMQRQRQIQLQMKMQRQQDTLNRAMFQRK